MVDQYLLKAWSILNIAMTSNEESCTVTKAGSLSVRYAFKAGTITGQWPSTKQQNRHHQFTHVYIRRNHTNKNFCQLFTSELFLTRGPKGHISCTWVQCATFWRISQGGHLVFPIGPENTHLVENVGILLFIKFHWILFSDFRGEVENVSANQRPGPPSCFSDRPEKHKLGRGRWDLASCQVSMNSVQRFQRRSRKCLSQSEARAAILFFRSA